MMVPCKSYKKKVVSLTVSIFEKEEKHYIEIHYPNKDVININYSFFQTPKQELDKIF